MQHRRPQGMSPLAIVLPHPSLPRRRSSLLSASASASSPCTPRSCGSPNCSSLFFPSGNRKSTDSWNSSNGPDDHISEWKLEQTLMLTRTLDALPPHLVTPFNGPTPPSNLLDKIARGVSQAKGADWPHSIRATRAKLLELARARAKEEALAADHRKIIAEEDDDQYSYFPTGEVLQQTTNIGRGIAIAPRRPLYRQSSMDFMNTSTDLKDNDNIARLSNRLQRSDRLIPNPSYHPYSRTLRNRNRSSSPPRPVPSLINPSTPSSTTLNSLSSLSASAARPYINRRSTSTLSSTSSSNLMNSDTYLLPAMAPDPRVQRVRRADSFLNNNNSNNASSGSSSSGSAPRQVFKRAPSFGALAQEARENKPKDAYADAHNNPYPSSDEEEKIRSKQAKKPRMRGAASPNPTSPPLSPSPMPSPTPVKSSRSKTKPAPTTVCTEASQMSPSPKSKSSGSKSKSAATAATATASPKPSRPTRPKANVQRNPSILGAELPHLHIPVQPQPLAHAHAQPRTPVTMHSPTSSPPSTQPATPATVASPKVKTLRRVRRLAPARRISFGSLVAPEGDEGGHDADGEGEEGLGSAFQLH